MARDRRSRARRADESMWCIGEEAQRRAGASGQARSLSSRMGHALGSQQPNIEDAVNPAGSHGIASGVHAALIWRRCQRGREGKEESPRGHVGDPVRRQCDHVVRPRNCTLVRIGAAGTPAIDIDLDYLIARARHGFAAPDAKLMRAIVAANEQDFTLALNHALKEPVRCVLELATPELRLNVADGTFLHPVGPAPRKQSHARGARLDGRGPGLVHSYAAPVLQSSAVRLAPLEHEGLFPTEETQDDFVLRWLLIQRASRDDLTL